MHTIIEFIDEYFAVLVLAIVLMYWILFVRPLTRPNNRRKVTIWDYFILGPMAWLIEKRQKESKAEKPFFSKFALIGICIFIIIVIVGIILDENKYESGGYDGTRWERKRN